MRALVVAASVLLSCAPPIRVPDLPATGLTALPGRGVEVCVLMQERLVRSRVEGVAEWSFEPWEYGIASVVVKHPSGLVVIDPAFGRDVALDLVRAPKLFAVIMGPPRTKTPMHEVMSAAGLDPAEVSLALATHVHWDHVGALGDVPNARVLLSRPELEWARGLRRYLDEGVMPHHLARAKDRMASFEFQGPARDGFPSSFDVFGDGALVAVPLPGHTPGSTAFFVKLIDGRTALFTGDASWTSRGIEAPAHKNPLARLDSDVPQTGDALGFLHALSKARPELLIIPAHDAAALERLPACGPTTVTASTR
ncbi:MAG: MBL fold metallo-hydrolase [Myxococcus sp.]|nr:MBL fold metallo-hydrolase [Myxococcus sp.]